MINQKERSRKYKHWHGKTIPVFVERIEGKFKCRSFSLNWEQGKDEEYIGVPVYKTHYNGKKVLVYLYTTDIYVNGCLHGELVIPNDLIDKFEQCLLVKSIEN